jgi:tyrosine decarboxylase / aspartate 1-decarboxylase
LPARFFGSAFGSNNQDRHTVTCLRSVLMKAEHRQWLDRIWDILTSATKIGSRHRSAAKPQPK